MLGTRSSVAMRKPGEEGEGDGGSSRRERGRKKMDWEVLAAPD